jgi:hypothetical protein
VLFRSLAGVLPFQAADMLELVMKIVSEAAPKLASAAPATPERLAALVDWMLATDPAARPSDARAVGTELAAIRGELAAPGSHARPFGIHKTRVSALVEEPETAAPAVQAPRRRTGAWLYPVITLALGGAVAGVLVVAAPWSSPRGAPSAAGSGSSPRVPSSAVAKPPSAAPVEPAHSATLPPTGSMLATIDGAETRFASATAERIPDGLVLTGRNGDRDSLTIILDGRHGEPGIYRCGAGTNLAIVRSLVRLDDSFTFKPSDQCEVKLARTEDGRLVSATFSAKQLEGPHVITAGSFEAALTADEPAPAPAAPSGFVPPSL